MNQKTEKNIVQTLVAPPPLHTECVSASHLQHPYPQQLSLSLSNPYPQPALHILSALIFHLSETAAVLLQELFHTRGFETAP